MSIKIYVKYVKNNRDFHTTKLNLPTGALDTETTREIMKVFIDLNKQGKTIIIVTHDLTVAEQCSRVIKIEDGVIIEGN